MICNEPVFYPNASILKIYTAEDVIDSEGTSGLGWVQVDLLGYIGEIPNKVRSQWTVDAMLSMPYGFKPNTGDGQSTSDKLESPMNQQYGFIAPPRRGDKAVVAYFGYKRYFVMLIYPATNGNEPLPYANDDLSMVHRSGASIRLNDHHPGITAPVPDEYQGITGSMTMVANRSIHLVGSKFLPYGLMAEYASQTLKIDLNDGVEDGYDYDEVFGDTEPGGTIYQPWDSSLGTDKFVSPPDSALPNTSNDIGSDEYYLLHQGGGLIKMETVNTSYTGMKLSADGMTIAVGTKYWDAGIQNKDTGHDGSTPDSTVVSNEFNFVHPTGTKIRVDTDGNVYITTEGKNVYLGDPTASKSVVRDGDPTSTHSTVNLFGIPCYDQPTGHNHTVTAQQSEVKVP